MGNIESKKFITPLQDPETGFIHRFQLEQEGLLVSLGVDPYEENKWHSPEDYVKAIRNLVGKMNQELSSGASDTSCRVHLVKPLTEGFLHLEFDEASPGDIYRLLENSLLALQKKFLPANMVPSLSNEDEKLTALHTALGPAFPFHREVRYSAFNDKETGASAPAIEMEFTVLPKQGEIFVAHFQHFMERLHRSVGDTLDYMADVESTPERFILNVLIVPTDRSMQPERLFELMTDGVTKATGQMNELMEGLRTKHPKAGWPENLETSRHMGLEWRGSEPGRN